VLETESPLSHIPEQCRHALIDNVHRKPLLILDLNRRAANIPEQHLQQKNARQ